jgi:UDP-N-acetylmuramoyl-tripeptide--D-alanyl-D-alanine ligase
MALDEAARALGLRTKEGWADAGLSGIGTDTRTLKPGELYVALKGENFDGHRFLGQALEKGAAAAVVRKGAPAPKGLTVLRVEDTLKGLGDLAAWFRRSRRIKVAAITGSNGKTTTKEMLVAILSRKFKVLATEGNFNNLVGLPLTIFRLRGEHEAAVLEMGMNRPGEIARLTEIAAPDVGAITNVGPAHIEGLGSLRGVAKAKGELFRGLGRQAVGVVNLDDPLVVQQAVVMGERRVTFGFTDKADVHAAGLEQTNLTGTRFTLVTPQGRAEVRFQLLGRHNVANALTAGAAASAFGLSPDEIAAGLNNFQPYHGRLDLKHLPGQVQLLDDTYNANPASTIAALEVLTSKRDRGRAVAVLGDMLELGKQSGSEHARVGKAAASLGVDVLVAVGRESRRLGLAAKNSARPPASIRWFADKQEATDWIEETLRPHDRILVKGSRGMHMEDIVNRLSAGREA